MHIQKWEPYYYWVISMGDDDKNNKFLNKRKASVAIDNNPVMPSKAIDILFEVPVETPLNIFGEIYEVRITGRGGFALTQIYGSDKLRNAEDECIALARENMSLLGELTTTNEQLSDYGDLINDLETVIKKDIDSYQQMMTDERLSFIQRGEAMEHHSYNEQMLRTINELKKKYLED